MFYKLALSFFFIIIFASCKKEETIACVEVGVGEASWYGPGLHGNITASGERFNMNDFTAAHRKLKFGTFLKVTNTKNNLSVIVKINDRGPFNLKRVIDLSKASAEKIDMLNSGIAEVKMEITGYEHINFRSLYKHYRNLLIIKSKEP